MLADFMVRFPALLISSWQRFKQLASAPGTPPADHIAVYAKDSGGNPRLFYKDDNGNEYGPVGGAGAPTDADYLVKTAHADLSAERVVTDTATIAADWGTAGQAKLNVVDGSITFAKIQNVSTDRLVGRDTAASGSVEEISLSTGLEFSGSQSIRVTTNLRTRAITFIIDGGGAVITTGIKEIGRAHV